MKNFLILWLVIFTLNNSIVWGSSFNELAQSVERKSHITTLDVFEHELEKVSLQFQNPMRDLDINLKNFSDLITIYDKFKKINVDFSNELLNKVKKDEPLSGAELYSLRRMAITFYKINKKILDFAKIYDVGNFKISNIIVNDSSKTRLIKAQLIWLTGQLLVLDHFEAIHTILYDKNGTFRRIVKNSLLNKSNDDAIVRKTINDLLKMGNYSVEIGESQKFIKQITLVRAIKFDLFDILAGEETALFLVKTIVSNKTAVNISQGKKTFKFEDYLFFDSAIDILNKVTGLLSQLFGNLVGSVHWRKGYLYNNALAIKLTQKNIIPMDILIEKSPFTLTDKIIPGHFDHIAIYLGTKEQLIALNMWNHPDIIAYQKDIENGFVVLEAVREGVHLSTLAEFLNIDELTIMRKDDGLKSPEILIEEITHGMDQIGKAYDFNFDVATLDKIVCSELIYITYGNVHWPTHYRFGRVTITPDDIAEVLFQKNTKFKIQGYILATEANNIKHMDLSYIADEFDYEKRTKEGEPVQNGLDQDNSYWKRETKCYNLIDTEDEFASESILGMNSFKNKITKRICKTSYQENFYEEKDLL
jgi:hypothetical protein